MHFFLKRIFLFALFFTIGNLSATSSTIISLGPNCQAAYRLNQCQLSFAFYPFDWILAPSIEAATKAIKEDFKNWMEPEYLEHNYRWISNNYYHIHFNHDFLIEEICDEYGNKYQEVTKNYLDYLPKVKKKYLRRIDRLTNLLKSTGPIIFLCTYTSPQKAYDFAALIKKKYPQLSFKLIVVNPGFPIHLEWVKIFLDYYDHSPIYSSVENVSFIQAFELETDCTAHRDLGWWSLEEWRGIFKMLNLLDQ